MEGCRVWKGYWGWRGIEWREWNESSVIEAIIRSMCLSYEQGEMGVENNESANCSDE